ncbi:MAG: DEAD/DEAH box helicase [Candidatus Methanomethylicaceae archaeon]
MKTQVSLDELYACDNCKHRKLIHYDRSSGHFVFPVRCLSPDEMVKIAAMGLDLRHAVFVVRDASVALDIMLRILGLHFHHPGVRDAARMVSYGLAAPIEWAYGHNTPAICPSGLSLLPHQDRAVRAITDIIDRYLSGVSEQRGVVLADDMGLGKTIMASCVINSSKLVRNVLVVCPASIVLKFAHELRKWLVKPFAVVQITRATVATHGHELTSFFQRMAAASQYSDASPITYKLPGVVVVTNYEYIENAKKILGWTKFDLLICDEAHYLKNQNAKRTKLILGEFSKAGFSPPLIPWRAVIHMTGTPAKNSLPDLFMLIKSANPPEWTKSEFLFRYCGYGLKTIYVRGYQKLVYDKVFDVEPEIIHELRSRLYATTMIRRTKSDVLKDLPEKIRDIISIDPGDRAILALLKREGEILSDAAKKLSAARDSRERFAVRSNALSELARARHEIAKRKIPYIIQHINDSLEGQSVVIFAYHRDIAEALAERLKCDFIHGDVPPPERDSRIKKFKLTAARSNAFLVATMHSCGLGIDLQEAQVCLFAELDWVPSTIAQAEDRLHRIGQKGSVVCQYFVVADSVDEKIARVINDKSLLIRDALGDSAKDTLLLSEQDTLEWKVLDAVMQMHCGNSAQRRRYADSPISEVGT